MKNDERWVVVNRNPNYEVSTLGRIRNRKTGRLRKLSRSSVSDYHLVVNLFDNYKVSGHSVSRLVGENFLPMTGGCILHRDETLPLSSVNALSNLYVGTQSENIKDAYDKKRKKYNGKKGETNHNCKLTEVDVLNIRKSWSKHPHPTRSELSKLYGVSPYTIKNVVLRKTWRHI